MHALSPAAVKGEPSPSPSRTAKRQRHVPRAPLQHVNAFSPNGVLLFDLRTHAQNSNGFVAAGDAFSAEPSAIPLRKDIAPFLALVDRDPGSQLSKGRSVGSSVLGSTVAFPAWSQRRE